MATLGAQVARFGAQQAGFGSKMAVQIVILAVSVARLSGGEEFVTARHRAAIHLARMHLLEVFLQDEIVAEPFLTDVAGGAAVRIGSGRVRAVVVGHRCGHRQIIVLIPRHLIVMIIAIGSHEFAV